MRGPARAALLDIDKDKPQVVLPATGFRKGSRALIESVRASISNPTDPINPVRRESEAA